MVDGACVCALVPRLALRTRLLVAMHFREWTKTTNTGHLAAQAVLGSRCALWGLGDGLRHVDGGPPDLWRAPAERGPACRRAPHPVRPAAGTSREHGLADPTAPPEEAARPWAFVLTLSDAMPLEAEALPPGPLCMVVPDGTWQQAAKLPRRIPALSGLPRFRLPDALVADAASFHLRHTERPGALATLHAVALALGLIEGGAAADALLAAYQAFVRGTLARRGPGRRPSASGC